MPEQPDLRFRSSVDTGVSPIAPYLRTFEPTPVSNATFDARMAELKQLRNSVQLSTEQINLQIDQEKRTQASLNLGIERIKVQKLRAKYAEESDDLLLARYGAAMKRDETTLASEQWRLRQSQHRETAAQTFLNVEGLGEKNQRTRQDNSVAESLSRLSPTLAGSAQFN